ncbi:amidohydrolase [Nocardia sp. 348MFTsu5.1]|uniref:amidohydrolase family protein n=1 Tax=Nocardia sp. 348MFTsu5.1 TaxID=1172185 RepID=UPI00035CF179|nr:amidohydrolase family protein [Nocardia sp. 348MFTsu5.1]
MAEGRASNYAREDSLAGPGEWSGARARESAAADSGLLARVIPGIIDTHIHQWDPMHSPWKASRRGRLYRAAPVLGKAIFRYAVAQRDRELILDPRIVARSYLPRNYYSDAAGAVAVSGVPVESVVYVETDWSADDPLGSAAETRWVTNLPFGKNDAPDLAAIVARGDPRNPKFGQLIDMHLDVSDKVRGIRCASAWHPDPQVRSWADRAGVLADPEFLSGFSAIAERDLVFEAWVYSHQLREVRALAREYPDTTIVLNHLGTPVGLFGPMGQTTGSTAAQRHELMRAWREDISALAQCRNVVAKLSGVAFPLLGYGHQRSGNIGTQQTLTNMTGPLIEHAVKAFGPDRLMFGSNFPADKPNATLPMIVGSQLEILEPYGGSLLRKVFRDNARRVYRLA